MKAALWNPSLRPCMQLTTSRQTMWRLCAGLVLIAVDSLSGVSVLADERAAARADDVNDVTRDSANESDETHRNSIVLGSGEDPFVIHWRDSYWRVRSDGNRLWMDRAARLHEIHPSHPRCQSICVWTPPDDAEYSKELWAPELHQFDGKWYIYVAASDGRNENHRMHVLERSDADPFGPFVYKAKIAPPTDRWAIDGTAFLWKEKLYFIWSGWPGLENGQQNLYIAPMSNPWTLDGERSVLSFPTLEWERHGLPINEGPQALINKGRLHVIYSGSGYWRHEYALGRLTYRGMGELTDPDSWKKSPRPVFAQSARIAGTGHASFVMTPENDTNWIVYHAHHNRDCWRGDRDIRIQPFSYSAGGTPEFGHPLPDGTID